MMMLDTSSVEYPYDINLLRRREIFTASYPNSPVNFRPLSLHPCITFQQTIIEANYPTCLLHNYNIMMMETHQSKGYLPVDAPLLPHSSEVPPHLQPILAQISSYMGGAIEWEPHQVAVNNQEHMMTILIRSEVNSSRTFYLGHGFGGSSLMYFPNFCHLLQHGNILLWEMRGMGVSHKIKQYNSSNPKEFFSQGLNAVLEHYRHPKIVFICHSFSAYITLDYLLRRPHLDSIEQVILLSPIGITPKALDYKDTVRSCSDIKNLLLSKFGWCFKLSYKSPLRTICCCFKQLLLKKGFGCLPLNQYEQELCVNLFLLLIDLPDGSDGLFFQCFHPRVLPREFQSIQELLQAGTSEYKYNTVIYYGGDQDWVDKQGAKMLQTTHSNIKVKIQPEYGHMMPLYPNLIKKIVQQQFESEELTK